MGAASQTVLTMGGVYMAELTKRLQTKERELMARYIAKQLAKIQEQQAKQQERKD